VYRVVSGVLAVGIVGTLVGVLGAGTIGMSTNLPPAALDLREGAGGRVQVDVPAPGAAATFHVTARPLTDGPTGLVLVVEDGEVRGSAGRAADDDVVLTLTDDTGAVLAAGSAAELRGAVVDLGVAEDVPVTVHGEASLRGGGSGGPDADGATVALEVRVAGAEVGAHLRRVA
jgi:hypothetical protein